MAIINLGQLGERRESALGGVKRAVGKYTDALTEAKATQAKSDSAKFDKSRTNFMGAYKNYWKKSDSERAMFDQLPEGKQFHKTAKTYIDEWYDKDNKPIRYPVERDLSPQEENAVKIDLERQKRGLPPSAEGAAAIIKVLNNQKYEPGSDKSDAEIDQAIEYYMGFVKNQFSGAIGGQGGGAPIDEQDPLGVFGR